MDIAYLSTSNMEYCTLSYDIPCTMCIIQCCYMCIIHIVYTCIYYIPLWLCVCTSTLHVISTLCHESRYLGSILTLTPISNPSPLIWEETSPQMAPYLYLYKLSKIKMVYISLSLSLSLKVLVEYLYLYLSLSLSILLLWLHILYDCSLFLSLNFPKLQMWRVQQDHIRGTQLESVPVRRPSYHTWLKWLQRLPWSVSMSAPVGDVQRVGNSLSKVPCKVPQIMAPQHVRGHGIWPWYMSS